jgi:hypothetical protein
LAKILQKTSFDKFSIFIRVLIVASVYYKCSEKNLDNGLKAIYRSVFYKSSLFFNEQGY